MDRLWKGAEPNYAAYEVVVGHRRGKMHISTGGLYFAEGCPIRFLQHIYLEFGYLMLVIRGDKEEEQKSADVGDEEVGRSKHFDEEAGSGGRRSKTGESSSSGSKIDFASTGTAEKADNSKVLGKDDTREVI